MQERLVNNQILIYSAHNEGMSVTTASFLTH